MVEARLTRVPARAPTERAPTTRAPTESPRAWAGTLALVLVGGLISTGCTMCPDPFDYSGPVPNGSSPQNDFRARSGGILPLGAAPRPWPQIVKDDMQPAPEEPTPTLADEYGSPEFQQTAAVEDEALAGDTAAGDTAVVDTAAGDTAAEDTADGVMAAEDMTAGEVGVRETDREAPEEPLAEPVSMAEPADLGQVPAAAEQPYPPPMRDGVGPGTAMAGPMPTAPSESPVALPLSSRLHRDETPGWRARRR
jgi:hypothetical protein